MAGSSFFSEALVGPLAFRILPNEGSEFSAQRGLSIEM